MPRRRRAAATDWAQIVALYDVLARAEPSPVVELNRAVAVAMRDGPPAGLELIDAILARGDLADYHLAHAARADLCRRLGRTADAGNPTGGPSRWRGRSRSGVSSIDASANWAEKYFSQLSIRRSAGRLLDDRGHFAPVVRGRRDRIPEAHTERGEIR